MFELAAAFVALFSATIFLAHVIEAYRDQRGSLRSRSLQGQR
jgi:hypothetical protein